MCDLVSRKLYASEYIRVINNNLVSVVDEKRYALQPSLR